MRGPHPHSILTQWRRRDYLLLSLTAISVALISIWCLRSFGVESYLLYGAMMILTLMISAYVYSRRRPTIEQVTRQANEQSPALEHSTELLLQDRAELNMLQQWQQDQTKEAFAKSDINAPIPSATIYTLLGGSLSALLVSLLTISDSMPSTTEVPIISIEKSEVNQTPIPEKDTAYISVASLSIDPPSYTAIAPSSSAAGPIEVAEGSQITWNMKVVGYPDQVYLLLSAGDTIRLQPPYGYSRVLRTADFYQYGLMHDDHEWTSDYYPIKVIEDQAPQIAISGQPEYLRLPWAENHDIPFSIIVSDDYGLDSAFISGTVAKGQGESVKFREKTFPLKGFSKGERRYQGSYTFSTAELDMEPGDELYFYVKAYDNCSFEQHWTKSVTHFVMIQDTTIYEYVDDGGMQVDLMPDFFRSQRQIIIDSEQLLVDRPLISQDSFKKASNALGYDQKMLRLKYGQFMGEENESGIAIQNEVKVEDDHAGHDHDPDEPHPIDKKAFLLAYMHDHDNENHEHGPAKAPASAHNHDHADESAMMDDKDEDAARPSWVAELSHNHDNEEANTLHNESVKSKLRAAMSEMWDAELHLRLYDPATSLPYQYASLELLQEIKNHARIYVHRIGFDPPVIKEAEKRLSGDLDEIISPATSREISMSDPYEAIKNAIAELQDIGAADYGNTLSQLEQAMLPIAIDRPEILPLLSDLRTRYRDYDAALISSLRSLLIDILPAEAEEVKQSRRTVHDISLQIAKKVAP